MAAPTGELGDLRQLVAWFDSGASPTSKTATLHRLARRLGATAVPLLGRELRHGDARRRDLARDALAVLATSAVRERVVRELRVVTEDDSADEAKVCALGLLAELGVTTTARFRDPVAIQRRSAAALATQLEGPADVASAADLMLRTLPVDEIAQLLEILASSAPSAARRLGTELADRHDVDELLRERIRATLAPLGPPENSAARVRLDRATQVSVLVDAAARVVVVVRRKRAGRRWRRWAVLIGPSGAIDDCLHGDDDPAADDAATDLVTTLCRDGYQVASADLDHARNVVAAAAQRTLRTGRSVGSAYYLGRDLLDLRDAHVLRRAREVGPSVVARALELLATGDASGARGLLEGGLAGSAATSAIAAAALAACLLVEGDHASALGWLERAISAEPTWPLHHWNHALAFHRLGDARGCHDALRRFVATSARPTAVLADPDQPARLAWAERTLAELQRSARLAGTPWTLETRARPRRRSRTGRHVIKTRKT